MANLPSPSALVQQALANGKAASQLVRENPPQPITTTPVVVGAGSNRGIAPAPVLGQQ